MTEQEAHERIAEIRERTGWDDLTMFQLLLTFVVADGKGAALVRVLRQVEHDEKEMTDG